MDLHSRVQRYYLFKSNLKKICLHDLAAENNVEEIKLLTSPPNHAMLNENTNYCGDELINASLQEDEDGNFPAMIAALRQSHEATLLLLSPFLNLHTMKHECISSLVHHRNRNGKSLLEIVLQNNKSMCAAYGIIIQLEGIVHGWNPVEFKHCIRRNLGTSSGAQDSIKSFYEIQPKWNRQKSFSSFIAVFIRYILILFCGRSILYAMDVISDCLVLHGHFEDWQNDNTSFPAMPRKMPDLYFRLDIKFDMRDDEDGNCTV